MTATTDMQGLETSSTETQEVRHLEGHTFKNITTTGNQITHLGTVHDTSNPLGATHVDTRPPDYSIPEQYQDHDAGRIDPNDGQEVVDYLNRRDTASPDDIGTSHFNLPDRVYYGDLRPRKESPSASYRLEALGSSGLAPSNSVWYSEHLRDAQRGPQ